VASSLQIRQASVLAWDNLAPVKASTGIANGGSNTMISARLDDVVLYEFWSDRDPTIRSKAGALVGADSGTAASAAVLLVFESGWRAGRHRHTAEETVFVLEGEGEMEMENETKPVCADGLLVVPAMVPHELRNVGAGLLRALAFFPAGAAITVWDETLMPLNSPVLVAPPPELLLSLR
jgi:mannose-6-phosphate isomerase-like protein (cupin superfamily)